MKPVTGWVRFAGVKSKVTFDLEGDFHRDIRGTEIRFKGNAAEGDVPKDAEAYMEGFAVHQAGKAGDITAGKEPVDYVDYPYIEWYGDHNGRVVLELKREQIQVLGSPIPASETDPISRKEQYANLVGFMVWVADHLNTTK